MTAILVVESDPGVAEFLLGVLQLEFAALVTSANTAALGAEALETAAFDLAIIDALMPDLPGYILAEQAVAKNVPALLCTGDANASTELDRHGFPHLAKPFEIPALVYAAAAIITHAAENLSRVKASLARLQMSATGLQATMNESGRLIRQSRALVSKRSSMESIRLETKSELVRDVDIPLDVVSEWLARMARRSRHN